MSSSNDDDRRRNDDRRRSGFQGIASGPNGEVYQDGMAEQLGIPPLKNISELETEEELEARLDRMIAEQEAEERAPQDGQATE